MFYRLLNVFYRLVNWLSNTQTTLQWSSPPLSINKWSASSIIPTADRSFTDTHATCINIFDKILRKSITVFFIQVQSFATGIFESTPKNWIETCNSDWMQYAVRANTQIVKVTIFFYRRLCVQSKYFCKFKFAKIISCLGIKNVFVCRCMCYLHLQTNTFLIMLTII